LIGITLLPSAIEAAAGMGHIHAELRRGGVTLWEEYRGHHPDGRSRSRFCDLCVVEWRHGITATMRKTHAAGVKLFMAFAEGTSYGQECCLFQCERGIMVVGWACTHTG
jgi:hypothetical protein